jgi:ADP-ribosylglycohydrolase
MRASSLVSRNEKGHQLGTDDRRSAIVSSALWAAAGDALGWVTELGDSATVEYRTGVREVHETVNWRRRIGGRFGPTVDLPAGTYSDDTQLRLAVCRATRGSGEFDVEAFAKVELPVWLSYALGGGRGTTAAAGNLSKSSVTWFSNFFTSREAKGYFGAGGNGAAMRIQPHIWKTRHFKFDEAVVDVLKDAVTTHGHPVGFCGAVFHGQSVAFALEKQRLPGPSDWRAFIRFFTSLPDVVRSDEHLGLFWLGPWEERYGSTFERAVRDEAARALALMEDVSAAVEDGPQGYRDVLDKLGGFREDTRGSGTNTAIAASALAYCCRDLSPEHAIRLGANQIGSDTDTITSMAGALVGAVQGGEPQWELQDRSYLVKEALRLADIGLGLEASSFQYPDLLDWTPPSTHGDAVGSTGNSLWLAGLGKVKGVGRTWPGSDAEWQWLALEFGQTVLAKRRTRPRGLSKADLPAEATSESVITKREMQVDEPSLFGRQDLLGTSTRRQAMQRTEKGAQLLRSIDELTEWVIAENFRADVVGNALLQATQGPEAIERGIALAAVIAKALSARRRRGSRF